MEDGSNTEGEFGVLVWMAVLFSSGRKKDWSEVTMKGQYMVLKPKKTSFLDISMFLTKLILKMKYEAILSYMCEELKNNEMDKQKE